MFEKLRQLAPQIIDLRVEEARRQYREGDLDHYKDGTEIDYHLKLRWLVRTLEAIRLPIYASVPIGKTKYSLQHTESGEVSVKGPRRYWMPAVLCEQDPQQAVEAFTDLIVALEEKAEADLNAATKEVI